MNNETFLQVQTLELKRLLEQSAADPILGPQLRQRLEKAEEDLRGFRQRPGSLLPKETPALPRAAIFLRGGGVQDSEGIRPGLAGEALIQYEKMFTEQALHDEREAAKAAGRQRRRRGAPNPSLLFTGTPRGSFGLEFVPELRDDDESLAGIHSQSLVHIAEALTQVAGGGTASLDEIVNKIPPRVLQPITQFLKTLAEYGAEVRLAFPEQPSRSLSASQVKAAADFLERDVTQEAIEIPATFRGVTRESGVYDLLTSEGHVITGTVADPLTEDDLERIDQLTNQQCVAKLQKTTVRSVGGEETTSYILLDALPAE